MQLAVKSFVLFSMSQWTVALFITCAFVGKKERKEIQIAKQ